MDVRNWETLFQRVVYCLLTIRAHSTFAMVLENAWTFGNGGRRGLECCCCCCRRQSAQVRAHRTCQYISLYLPRTRNFRCGKLFILERRRSWNESKHLKNTGRVALFTHQSQHLELQMAKRLYWSDRWGRIEVPRRRYNKWVVMMMGMTDDAT